MEATAPDTFAAGGFRVGDWDVDPASDEVRRGEQVARLEPRVMRLLVHLAVRPGAVVSTDELLDSVWKGVVVTPDSVYTSVARLRRVLEDGAPDPYVVTVPRRGYRLVAPVTRPAAPDPTAVGPRVDASPTRAQPSDASPSPPEESRRRRRRLASALFATACAAVGAMVWWTSSPPRTPPGPPVVAVLPFSATADAEAIRTLAVALGDELRADLARMPQVGVIGTTTTAAFRDREPRTLAREFGVTDVVVGTVAADVERTRIAVQRLDAATGRVVWSRQFQRERDGLPALTGEVAAALAGSFGGATGPADEPRRTRSAAAYEAYLEGRRQQQLWTPESFARAAYHYGRAIAADPNFTLAHVGIAEIAIGRQTVTALSINEAAAVAEPAIARALEMAPASADAFAARGLLRTNQWRIEEAIADLRRAIALNPNLVEAYVRLAVALEYAGRPREALDVLDAARGRDPLHYMLHVRRCLALQNLGRTDEARQACAAALAIDAVRPNARWAAALAELADGRLDRAIEGYHRTIEASPSRAQLHEELGWLYLDAGQPRLAEASFATAKLLAPAVAPTGPALVGLAEGDLAVVRAELEAIATNASPSQDGLLDAAALAFAIGETARGHALIARAEALPTWSPWYTRSIWAIRWGRSQELTLAIAARLRGDEADMRERLRSLEAYLADLDRGGQRWAGIAYLRAGIRALDGRREEALVALDAAAAAGWRRAWWPRHDPALAPLRDEPRFRAWLQRVGAARDANGPRVR
jgi:DNA-binding winged helix-turn-helix (wHTH) protein/TolB-like protein/tetratricopeptide (TPR) repeat protein